MEKRCIICGMASENKDRLSKHRFRSLQHPKNAHLQTSIIILEKVSKVCISSRGDFVCAFGKSKAPNRCLQRLHKFQELTEQYNELCNEIIGLIKNEVHNRETGSILPDLQNEISTSTSVFNVETQTLQISSPMQVMQTQRCEPVIVISDEKRELEMDFVNDELESSCNFQEDIIEDEIDNGEVDEEMEIPVATPSVLTENEITPTVKVENYTKRCNKCDGCNKGDCGNCEMCLDRPNNRQACLLRKCLFNSPATPKVLLENNLNGDIIEEEPSDASTTTIRKCKTCGDPVKGHTYQGRRKICQRQPIFLVPISEAKLD